MNDVKEFLISEFEACYYEFSDASYRAMLLAQPAEALRKKLAELADWYEGGGIVLYL